jgi:hypothetical protein
VRRSPAPRPTLRQPPRSSYNRRTHAKTRTRKTQTQNTKQTGSVRQAGAGAGARPHSRHAHMCHTGVTCAPSRPPWHPLAPV